MSIVGTMFFLCFIKKFYEIAKYKTINKMATANLQSNEPQQYLNNAHSILNEDLEKDDRYYSSKNYVREAGKLALNGVLLALKNKFDLSENFNFTYAYQKTIKEINPYMAKVFANAYETLSKCLVEDGNLNIVIVQEGLAEAQEIVSWCETINQNNVHDATTNILDSLTKEDYDRAFGLSTSKPQNDSLLKYM
jgi:Domain of unknown function (DUF5618)